MANVEKSGYMKYKDKSGNMTTMYPKTKVANVEGLSDELSKLDKVFLATYNVTTASEIHAAYAAGKTVVAKVDGTIEYLYSITGSGNLANCHFARLSFDKGSGSAQMQFRTVVNAMWGSLTDGYFIPDLHASDHATGGADPITPASIGAIPTTEKGAASGVATLDTDGKIPTEQLPAMGSGWDIETVTLTVPGSVDVSRFSYANGKVFTVHNGNTNTIYCTTDGVNWTSVTLPSTDAWGDVAYGANKYVVCGTGKFAYSADGITWTQGSMPDSYPMYHYGLTYSGGIFVALSNYSRACAYSTDGVTWTAMSILSDGNSMKGIATRRYWNGSKYVNVYVCAFSGSTGYIAYSTDGKTWEQRSLPSGVTKCESIFFMSEKLVVDSGTQTYYSTDYGNNWSNFAVPITSSPRYMAYCGLGGYAVCVSGTNLAYSADLTEWTVVRIPVSNQWSGLATVQGSKAMLCGFFNNKYLITTNLLHWRNQISIIKKDGVDITAQVQAAFY